MEHLESNQKKPKLGLIMAVYLAGIFMGAIDTGIVTPARTIIQNGFGVDPQTGIWMITIYTLAYAASVPIMGKLADRHGRKYIYITCISLFAIGSLFCGLSENFGGFPLLIAARVVQAIGGGGIVPIATAEFGTTFPPEKRGMALGLVGGVYGIANVFGASAGSAILDIVGVDNWQYIFFINLPISVFIIIAGLLTLEQGKEHENWGKIDLPGIFTLTLMILSVLYGLKNLDFFDFSNSIKTTSVYPFLLIFIVLVPLFIFFEKRSEDPVMNLRYFTNRNILVTLLLSTISGFVMMGVIFVPQFSENCLKLATGSGGYLVIILGIFAGVGAPVSGRLIDKFGAKIILAFGFLCSIAGALFMIFVTTVHPGTLAVVIGLMLSGLGMGFTMGTPVNYMMLANTDPKESNSSLAALSLVRSIGTAIAPAIMVGFIANAGMAVQSDVIDILPKEISVPSLTYAQEIDDQIAALRQDPNTKDKLEHMDFPSLTEMNTVEINMNKNSDVEIPDDIIELLQSSDVTTITENTKTMAKTMFNIMCPTITKKINDGIKQGIGGIDSGIAGMKSARLKLKDGYDGIGKGINGMSKALTNMKAAKKNLESFSEMMGKMSSNMTQQTGPTMPPQAGPITPHSGTSLLDMLPDFVKAKIPKDVLDELAGISTLDELKDKIHELDTAIAEMSGKIQSSKASQEKMSKAISAIDTSIDEMATLKQHLKVSKDSVPRVFDKALKNYLKAIDKVSDRIESTFQATLNKGFKDVYWTTVIAAIIALGCLCFYRKKDEL